MNTELNQAAREAVEQLREAAKALALSRGPFTDYMVKRTEACADRLEKLLEDRTS